MGPRDLEQPGRPDTVLQDGVRCPRNPPWSPAVRKITALPFIPIVLLAVGVLVQTAIAKLLLWLLLVFVFAYPLRYLVCARCPYYGENCSSVFGRLVTRMFPKQEGRSMKLGLWLDVAFFTVLFLVPLPDMWRVGGFILLLLWLTAFAAAFLVLTRTACHSCPLTFCPIGRGGRAVWGRFSPT